jgi:hypothetical protein
MNLPALLATFAHESDLLHAADRLRQAGFQLRDVYAPYPVHGLDRVLGLRPSRLSWVCFVCGAIGLLGMLWFEHWTSATNWPINVGGKPWNSLPADAPVAFESLVLLAGFGTVLALFAVCRLVPGRTARTPSPRVTDDRFVLVVEQSSAVVDAQSVRHALGETPVVSIEEWRQ